MLSISQGLLRVLVVLSSTLALAQINNPGGSSSSVLVSGVNGHFVDHQSDPLLSPSGGETITAFGNVLKVGSTYHMYYMYSVGNFAIGHATSSDGVTWTKDTVNNPVLNQAASGTWDNTGVGVPTVWLEGSTWNMLYRGTGTGDGKTRGGFATSSDGVTWTRTPNNLCAAPANSGNGCVLDIGYVTPASGEPEEFFGVIKVGSTYYAGTDNPGGATRAAGIATSTDLIHWTKDAANPLFLNGRYDQAFFKIGNYYYEILPHYLGINNGTQNAELEMYRSPTMPFYPSSRTYLGVVKQQAGVDGSSNPFWNSYALDTPFVLTDDVTRSTFNLTGGDLWMYYAGTSTFNHVNFFTGLAIAAQGLQAPFETFQSIPNGGNIVGALQIQNGSVAGNAGNVLVNGANGVQINNPNAFAFWTGRAQLSSPADGRVLLQNNAGTQNIYTSTIVPTSCAVTGGGTGATCTLEAKSSDSKGRIVITAGTTAATSGTFTLTYSTALGTTSSVCSFTLSNGTGTWNARASLIETTPSTASDIGNWDNNAVALTNASTYKIAYDCNGT